MGDRRMWCAEFGENQLQGMLRSDKIRSEGAVEEITLRFEASAGGARFFYPFDGKIAVLPASKKVLVTPIALAVSQKHENAIHVSTELDIYIVRSVNNINQERSMEQEKFGAFCAESGRRSSCVRWRRRSA